MASTLCVDVHIPPLQHLPSQDEVDPTTTQYCYGHDQKRKKKDLMHFRIPDIQKLKVALQNTNPLYIPVCVCAGLPSSPGDHCYIHLH